MPTITPPEEPCETGVHEAEAETDCLATECAHLAANFAEIEREEARLAAINAEAKRLATVQAEVERLAAIETSKNQSFLSDRLGTARKAVSAMEGNATVASIQAGTRVVDVLTRMVKQGLSVVMVRLIESMSSPSGL